MIKLYITAIQSNDNGTAVVLFEDYKQEYETAFDLDCDEQLGTKIVSHLNKVEKEKQKQSEPL